MFLRQNLIFLGQGHAVWDTDRRYPLVAIPQTASCGLFRPFYLIIFYHTKTRPWLIRSRHPPPAVGAGARRRESLLMYRCTGALVLCRETLWTGMEGTGATELSMRELLSHIRLDIFYRI